MKCSQNCVRRCLQTVLAIVVLGSLSVVTPFYHGQASAMDHAEMADAMQLRNTCCPQAGGAGTLPETLAIDERHEANPDPEPVGSVAFFVQFQSSFIPKTVQPAREHRIAVLRPPDIITQTAVYRI